MNVHVVDSKEHMLEPNDIFIVAAHEFKEGLPQYSKIAKKYGISPERMQYTVMMRSFQDPSLIRIREGNTLFAIRAMPDRAGFVMSFNADTAPNFINNMVEFFQAARALGFDLLIAQTHSGAIVKAMKLAAKKIKDPDAKIFFSSEASAVIAQTGKRRS